MCTDLTLESDVTAGLVLSLCERPATCLVDLFRLDPRTAAPQVFQTLAQPNSFAVIEWIYFDLDYRSEFTVTHETSFPVRDPNASRINFFGTYTPDQPISLYDAVLSGCSDYRGYCVIRPQVVGAIGRTMVTTNAVLTRPADRAFSGLRKGAVLGEFIRTAVVEDVEVFGVGLRVVGVPFMEQDQHLLRCAHVSAWICHYTAVLRGLVPRRPTAQFHLAEDATAAYGRAYPSYGLSSWSLSRVLRQLDLPPEILTQADLLKPVKPRWYSHQPFAQYVGAHDKDSDEARRAFVAHNLSNSLCRYLNSGVPVILNREKTGHTQVVCGYLRQEDVLAPQEFGTALLEHSDVVAFIVSDDGEGPYSLVWMDDLIDEVVGEDPNHLPLSVTVPLPHGLWLTGTAAERGGARALRSAATTRLAVLNAWLQEIDRNDELDMHRELLNKVVGGAEADVTVRSYAMLGSEFKTELIARAGDEELRRLAARTPLPRYVWVVELVDRTARRTSPEHVLGCVVLDASAVAGPSAQSGNVISLLIHIPGQVSIPSLDDLYENQSWIRVAPALYRSGRIVDWAQRGPSSRFKTAVSRPSPS